MMQTSNTAKDNERTPSIAPTKAPVSNTPALEYMLCDTLRTQVRSTRKHSRGQIQHIERGLRMYGQVLPILIDEHNNVVDGYAVLEASKNLNIEYVLATRVTHLSKSKLRALRLSLNKLAELGEWDVEALQIELGDISLLEPDIDLDIPGFETADLDVLLADTSKDQEVDEDDDLPNLKKERQTVCREGDLWQLGNHRLAVGNALERRTYTSLMDGKEAQLTLTDPPYNVPIDGHVSGLGSAQHREFAFASGEMTGDEFPTFLTNVLQRATSVSVDGALVYVFMDWRHQRELLTAASTAALTQVNLCVWTKTNAGMGSFYRSQHELVYVGKKGVAPHINNIQLGKHGRNRTNVWPYAGMNTFHAERDELLAAHPTVKPVSMIADAICDSTNRGDIVLDPFVGSGTVFLAAERTGRWAFGIEIDADFCELAIDRWERKTGKKAIHSQTGLTRDELLDRRRPARKRSMPQKLRNTNGRGK